ncbi:uncharacterized protein PHALS_04374 [Plasmopara halstedii]|uniref:Uncharacterized protein n=1 Tax=Plasmopara halstedii TaxID=4781 RepID=A0A0P1B1A5_PLAHL|nr:uncharacterized protein PHALS_04374 [Plasmopara halstedii]CEG47505.1 hypothetical protein PHALS_04374 [Plasmopara halstedii]|eukprot:XP_024583874.1 hypothetical protein PHALS_04374 [Plasmopara halstedii]
MNVFGRARMALEQLNELQPSRPMIEEYNQTEEFYNNNFIAKRNLIAELMPVSSSLKISWLDPESRNSPSA